MSSKTFNTLGRWWELKGLEDVVSLLEHQKFLGGQDRFLVHYDPSTFKQVQDLLLGSLSSPKVLWRVPIEGFGPSLPDELAQIDLHFKIGQAWDPQRLRSKGFQQKVQSITCQLNQRPRWDRAQSLFWQQFRETDRLHFEVSPWTAARPHGFTITELGAFLARLKRCNPSLRISGPVTRLASTMEAFQPWKWLSGPKWLGGFANNELPKISVIIPSKDAGRFLIKVIHNLTHQSADRRRFELIVVEDGGTDNNAQHLREMSYGMPPGFQFQFFHWPREKSRQDQVYRAGHCRNFAVSQARGEFLLFLDSDILVDKNFLERLPALFESSDVIQWPRHHLLPNCSSQIWNYDEVKPKDSFIEEAHYWRPFFQTKEWMSLCEFWKYTCTYALAIRQKDFLQLGGFKWNFVKYGFEDVDLGFEAYQRGLRFHLEPKPVFHLSSPFSWYRYNVPVFARHQLLQPSAQTFYRNHLHPQIYQCLRGLLSSPNFANKWYNRWRCKNESPEKSP